MIQISLNLAQNFALVHKTRRDIIKKLHYEDKNATELSKELKQPVTNIRHHLDILLKAKLVYKTRMVEKRGSYTKYYKTDYTLKVTKR